MATSQFMYLTCSTAAVSGPLAGPPTFSPLYGTTATQITITGSGFTGTTVVTINGTNATSVVVVSDTEITCYPGSGTTTGPIVVETPSGNVTSGLWFAYSRTAVKALANIATTSAALLLEMNEGTGSTTADASSNNNTYTLGADATWTTDAGGLNAISVASGSSTAYSIHGADTGLPATNVARSVAVKFKLTSDAVEQMLLAYGTNSSGEYTAFANTATGEAFIGINGSNVTATGGAITNSAWHVAVLTYAGGSGGTATLYVDGASVGSGALTFNTVLSGTASLAYTAITSNGAGTTCVYDYAGVWARVLTAAEIAALV